MAFTRDLIEICDIGYFSLYGLSIFTKSCELAKLSELSLRRFFYFYEEKCSNTSLNYLKPNMMKTDPVRIQIFGK